MPNKAKKLTDKQAAFVREYVQCWNATEAAKRAGYSEQTARQIGAENLSKPDIEAAIKAEIERLAMSGEEVLLRLGQQARGEHSRFWKIDCNGVPRLDFKELMEAGLAHLVKEFELHELTGNIKKVKFYDAQAALKELGRYHQLFVDKTEVEHSGQIEIESEDKKAAAAEMKEWREAMMAELKNFSSAPPT